MVFFLFGYFAYLVIEVKSLPFPLELVTSSVFFGGAVFVFLVIKLTQITINKVIDSEQRVTDVNQQLVVQNKALEEEIVARTEAETRANSRLQYFTTLHAM